MLPVTLVPGRCAAATHQPHAGGKLPVALHTVSLPRPISIVALLHTYTQVDMSKKPTEFKELYHSIIPDTDVRERVPVLVNGTNRLVDSTTIVEYLAAAYPESGTPLTPADPYTAARVKLFVHYFTVRQSTGLAAAAAAAAKQAKHVLDSCFLRHV